MIPAAYIWSPALQAAADALPANKGRSSRVHSLIRALGLVQAPTGADEQDNPTTDANADLDTDGDGDPNDEANGNDGKVKTHSPAVIVPPDLTLATEAELRRYHDKRYVEYILRNGANDTDEDSSDDSDEDADSRRKRRRVDAGLEYDCPPFAELNAYARLVAASTLTACKLVTERKARVAIVWDGGRHHALRAQASGFCYVADAVLGILYLSRWGVPFDGWESGGGEGEGAGTATGEDRAEGKEETHGKVNDDGESTPPPPPPPPPRTLPRRPRILYLDMDLHYGDGVALAFKSPTHYAYPLRGRPRAPQVLTLSVHHQSPIFFPPGAPGLTTRDTPHPFSLSYPLAAFASTRTYFRAWESIEKIAQAWAPDYVVLQLGVDGLPRDPVGMYGAWGVQGPGSAPWVVGKVLGWDRPTVVLGGGGYVNDNAARAWALSTARIVGAQVEAGDTVPDHEFWSEYAPGYTLEVEESHAPDENTPEMLDIADDEFGVLAERIREIVALNS